MQGIEYTGYTISDENQLTFLLKFGNCQSLIVCQRRQNISINTLMHETLEKMCFLHYRGSYVICLGFFMVKTSR